MTSRHWTTLARVYLARMKPALLAGTFAAGPLALFFARRSDYAAPDVATNLLIVALMWPLAAAGVVGKCKADGSLAFLASLPVSRHDHARAWLAVITVLAVPAAVMIVVASGLHADGWGIGRLTAMGAGVLAAIVALVSLVVAVQLSAPPATAFVYFANGVTAVVVAGAGLSQFAAWQQLSLTTLVQSRLLVPTLSLTLWSVAGFVLWWSWQRIGHFMTSYVGDPPRA